MTTGISLYFLVFVFGYCEPLLYQHSIGRHYHPIAYGRAAKIAGWPSPIEVDALWSFYNTTFGDTWSHNDGWLSGNPCNGWFGVVCNSDDSVSALLLTENNLVGTVPNSIANLTSLEVLDVSFNSLFGTIDRNIFNKLNKFREFYLNNNQFTGTLDFLEDLVDHMEVIYLPENSFAGSIPSTIGRFTKVWNLQLFGNEVSGTIPPSMGQMISLESLDFGFNKIKGTLPDSIGDLVNLQYFWFYDDQLTGTLPDSFGKLTNLILFECTRNRLEGLVPDSLSNWQLLEVLRLGGNNFTGIPYPVCDMSNLTDAVLFSNQFSAIPPCRDNSRMTNFLMNNNQLEGSIPEELGNLLSLKRIDLSHNRISGTMPASFGNLRELILLDLSHNILSTGLEDILLPLARLERFTSVDVSYNKIYGTIPYSIVWNDSTQEELSKSITYLYLNNNNLSGNIPDYLSWMYRLLYADLSQNNFSGAVPELLSYLSTLYVSGNPYMVGTNRGELPSFLIPDYTSMKKSEKGEFSCPGLTGADGEFTVGMDPSYYNYSYCRCEVSYWGVNGTCKPCPSHATCPGGGMTIIVDPGYYPYPEDPTSPPAFLVKCSKDNFGFTPCNPSSKYPFTCKNGYEGRLCSKCSEDHFSRGIECIKCLGNESKIAVGFFLVAVVITTYLFFLLTGPVVSLPSASRKTGMFYFQALNLLLTRFTGWPSVFWFLSTVSAAFNFGFNFTCVFFDYYTIFYVLLVLPLLSVVVNAIMLGVVYVAHHAISTEINMERWVHGAIRTVLLTLNFLYLPLCTSIMSMFVCLEDGYNRNTYLAVAPWIQCNNSTHYTVGVAVAAFFFIFYALGIPVLFGYLLYRFRLRLQERKILASIGSLYVDYTEKSHYFEIAGLCRRFLFALVVAAVKQDNLFLMSTILFTVLLVYASLQVRIRPFNYRLSNILELTGIGVLAFNLVSILSASSENNNNSITTTNAGSDSNGDGETGGGNSVTVMQVLVLFVNLVYILMLVAGLCFGLSQLVMPERWKNGIQEVKSLAYLSHKQTRVFELRKEPQRSPSCIKIASRMDLGEEEEGTTTTTSSSSSSQSPPP